MDETSDARAPRAAWIAAWIAIVAASAGCAHRAPCRATGECAVACSLDGACGPRPTTEAVRFVEVRELVASPSTSSSSARLVLGAAEPDAELAFGPRPPGRMVSAVLRISPYPGVTAQADAIAEVRRGRKRVTVRYAAGRDAPLHVDVSSLLDGLDEGDAIALTVRLRGPRGSRFEAASPASPDVARRPTLALVLR